MARPREFDREEALNGAIQAFAESGYAGTSTDTLLHAMHLGRQSLYNAFGDKGQLYREALRTYIANSVAEHIRTLNSAASARKGIERLLGSFARRPPQNCLGISATCEFGRSDPTISALSDAASGTLGAALEQQLVKAKAEGDVAFDIDEKAAAHFLMATLTGIKVAARGGASRETLQTIATMALRSLD